MAWRMDAATVPSPPSGAPPPAMVANIQKKNQATLPSPPRSTGTVSNSTAAAAVTASTGRVSRTNGSSSAPGRTAADSPRASWRASAVPASTAAMEPRTMRLLRNLPAR